MASGLVDGVTVLDWLLRLSNVLGLVVLFQVARKIGAFESLQAQTKTHLVEVAKDVKELSRVVSEMVGANRGGRLSGPL